MNESDTASITMLWLKHNHESGQYRLHSAFTAFQLVESISDKSLDGISNSTEVFTFSPHARTVRNLFGGPVEYFTINGDVLYNQKKYRQTYLVAFQQNIQLLLQVDPPFHQRLLSKIDGKSTPEKIQQLIGKEAGDLLGRFYEDLCHFYLFILSAQLAGFKKIGKPWCPKSTHQA